MADESEQPKRAADRIIEGLKQAAQSAQCEHDWEVESAAAWRGEIKRTTVCSFCGCRRYDVLKS